MSLHIGVDATCWNLTRGFGRHARCLLTALVNQKQPHRYTFVMDQSDDLWPLPPQIEVIRLAVNRPTIQAAARGSRRSLVDMWRLSRVFADPSFDRVLFPTAFSYVPFFSRARKWVMLLDVTAELYPGLTFESRKARFFWQLKTWAAVWQAHRILTISEHSRRGLAQYYRRPASSIDVVELAASEVFRPLRHPRLSSHLRQCGLDPQRPMVVYLGGFGPLKNVSALIAAFARLERKFPDCDLVLVGEHQQETFHSTFDQLVDQVARLGLQARVHFTGYVPDEELAPLLNLAQVLVLPSFNEGFGLPAVEAAACGCPVIATRSSPLPELLQEGGLYIDPHEPQQLEQALERVLEDQELRQEMSRAALRQARQLCWNLAAQRLLQSLVRA